MQCENAGIPGCAKSALCKEILNAPGGLEDDRPIHSLMGDLIKGMRCFSTSFWYVPYLQKNFILHVHVSCAFRLLSAYHLLTSSRPV